MRLRKYKMARPLVVPCQWQDARPGRKGGRRQEDRKYMRESLTPVTIRKLTLNFYEGLSTGSPEKVMMWRENLEWDQACLQCQVFHLSLSLTNKLERWRLSKNSRISFIYCSRRKPQQTPYWGGKSKEGTP